jgi:hypothetical protein
VQAEFGGQVVCVAVVHTVVYAVGLLAQTVTVSTLVGGPETLCAATEPGLPTVPVAELKRLHFKPSVDTATQAAYLSQISMHDWMVYIAAWRL